MTRMFLFVLFVILLAVSVIQIRDNPCQSVVDVLFKHHQHIVTPDSVADLYLDFFHFAIGC